MTGIDQLTNLGAAGLMGAMWLWERRTSQKRELQLDEAHTRILSDRVQLSELMDVVRQNTEAIVKSEMKDIGITIIDSTRLRAVPAPKWRSLAAVPIIALSVRRIISVTNIAVDHWRRY